MERKIELNHLKYFYFTALEGGVSQAANRLHVQQPVVSKMLKTLEDNLEQPLFWKRGRNKELTDYGQLIFRHCQVIFKQVADIEQSHQDPYAVTGVFKVGGAEPIVNGLFSPVFAKLMPQLPNLNYNIVSTTQLHLLEMLCTEKIDIGCFFYIRELPRELEIVKKIPYRFRLVIKTTEKRNQQVIQSFIGSREADDQSTHKFPTIELMREKYPETRIVFSSNNISLHKQMVLAGKGVSILPEFLIKKELTSKQMTDLYPKQNFQWDLMVVKRKSEPLNLIRKLFMNTLAEPL